MNTGRSCDWCWYISFFGFFRSDLSPWEYGNMFSSCTMQPDRKKTELGGSNHMLFLQKLKITGVVLASYSAWTRNPVAISGGVDTKLICYDRWVLSKGHKNYVTDLYLMNSVPTTAQKVKFSIKDFFNKCDQIRRKLRIWSHLLEKSLMENFIFCAVYLSHFYLFFCLNKWPF